MRTEYKEKEICIVNINKFPEKGDYYLKINSIRDNLIDTFGDFDDMDYNNEIDE